MSWFWRGVAATYDAMVVPSFGAPGFEARQRSWTSDVCGDVTSRHIAISGANSGLGFAASCMLAAHGATVHMLCRDETRGAAAARRVAEHGVEPVLHIVDMSDLHSVASFCRSFIDSGTPLDALIHNAGALVHERLRTSQDLELTFACHVVGPFLATNLLLQRMTEREPSAPNARVVFVSSGGMYTQKLSLRLLQQGPEPYDGLVSYAQCKRAQVLLAERFAQQYADRRVAFSSMHPGWVETPGVSASIPTFDRVMKPILRTPEQGADTMVWLAASDEANDVHGEFYFDREPRSPHIPLRKTQSSAAEVDDLWALLVRITE